jgi:cysteine desulfurase/selenocysteine lyase
MISNPPKPLDVNRLRSEFPILSREVRGRKLAYLDNAATSQKPRLVLDALDRYWQGSNANIHRGVHTLSQEATAQFDEAREVVRCFLNAAESAEVIFTKGCTEGINLVAHGLPLQPGDRILLTTMEHHSNIVPWQLAAQRSGATVEPIHMNDRGETDLEDLARLLAGGRVAMVGVVHVSNSLGTVNPVKQIARMAHDAGALVLVDGAQAGPHLLIDVQDLDADFYTLSCHKIYAPTGVGVLYGKRRLLDSFPPYHGGGDMIRTVSFDGTTYADLPAKFEAGTPNIAGVIGLGWAMRWLASLGTESAGEPNRFDPKQFRSDLATAFERVGTHERELTEYGTAGLGEIPGVRLVGTAEEKAGILAFVMDGVHPHDIGTILDAEGVAIRAGHHCCMPLMTRLGVPATARASLAAYSTRGEIDSLVRGVRKVKEMFG